jgi:hypothetical protein
MTTLRSEKGGRGNIAPLKDIKLRIIDNKTEVTQYLAFSMVVKDDQDWRLIADKCD